MKRLILNNMDDVTIQTQKILYWNAIDELVINFNGPYDFECHSLPKKDTDWEMDGMQQWANAVQTSRNSEDIDLFGKELVDYTLDYHLIGIFNKKQEHIDFKIILGPNVSDASYLFADLENLETIPRIFTTSNLKKADNMFARCYKLKRIPSFDMNNLESAELCFADCKSVESFPKMRLEHLKNGKCMFLGCTAAKSFEDFDFPCLERGRAMFSKCRSLEKVPKINFGLDDVNLSFMFSGCENLKYVKDFIFPKNAKFLINNFCASNVFEGCPKIVDGYAPAFDQYKNILRSTHSFEADDTSIKYFDYNNFMLVFQRVFTGFAGGNENFSRYLAHNEEDTFSLSYLYDLYSGDKLRDFIHSEAMNPRVVPYGHKVVIDFSDYFDERKLYVAPKTPLTKLTIDFPRKSKLVTVGKYNILEITKYASELYVNAINKGYYDLAQELSNIKDVLNALYEDPNYKIPANEDAANKYRKEDRSFTNNDNAESKDANSILRNKNWLRIYDYEPYGKDNKYQINSKFQRKIILNTPEINLYKYKKELKQLGDEEFVAKIENLIVMLNDVKKKDYKFSYYDPQTNTISMNFFSIHREAKRNGISVHCLWEALLAKSMYQYFMYLSLKLNDQKLLDMNNNDQNYYSGNRWNCHNKKPIVESLSTAFMFTLLRERELSQEDCKDLYADTMEYFFNLTFRI